MRDARGLWTVTLGVVGLVAAGCDTRDPLPRDPRYADVAPILARACVPCHGGDTPEAGWRADRYLDVIACPDGSASAVTPPDPRAPILAVLDREDHAGRLMPIERALLHAWVTRGAQDTGGALHPVGWSDPRSPSFHGATLRRESWVRMLDESARGACVSCHETAAVDGGVAAPGATRCAACHREPDGPRACSTCHGQLGRAYPPRDPCFYPDGPSGGAHAAHVEQGLACAVCHGERTVEELGRSEHGDGVVQVSLDAEIAGRDARWDAVSGTCTGSCHDRGGSGEAAPSWEQELVLDCNSCHLSPPDAHYLGRCDGCHAEASADGSALRAGPLHVNGRVDLGDGSGECGACHGDGTGPWPLAGAHPAHRTPTLSPAISCNECHQVPTTVEAEGHWDDTPGAEVQLGDLARARGAAPRYETGSCIEVACHGGGPQAGRTSVVSWDAGPGAAACGACHGLPPGAPHSRSATCGATLCHQGSVGPDQRLTEQGVGTHVNGLIDVAGSP